MQKGKIDISWYQLLGMQKICKHSKSVFKHIERVEKLGLYILCLFFLTKPSMNHTERLNFKKKKSKHFIVQTKQSVGIASH